MSTITKSRSHVKPARFIRLELTPFEGNPGVIKITVGKISNDYLLEPLGSDFGTAYRLTKEGGDTYHVNLNGEQSTCECKGFLKWGRCKHIAGLIALRNADQL